MTEIELLSKADIREYNHNHMYVLNISDHKHSKPRQQLLMTFVQNGKDKIIVIPSTWIPIDLTSLVGLEDIKVNSDFWLFINRRDLAVISRDTAEEVLNEEDAISEYDRIYGIDDSSVRDRIHLNKNTNIKKEKKIIGSAKVISIMKKTVSENLKLAALKNIKHELSTDDFRYILNEAKIGENDKLKNFALGELQN